jgi:hypothetical protein
VPPVVWLVLAAAVLLSIGALAWTVRTLARRLLRLGRDLDDLRLELTPALRQLEVDGEVTAAEVAAIGDRLDARARLAARRRQ